MVASPRAVQGSSRSQVRGMVGQDRIRRRVTMNVFGSARRRLWAQVKADNMTEVHRPDFIGRSRLHLMEDLRMKRGVNEKKCRALTLSRLPSNSNSPSTSSNGSRVARLPPPITVRDTGSRKVERRNNQKKLHRHGPNNFGAITPAAPE